MSNLHNERIWDQAHKNALKSKVSEPLYVSLTV